MKKNQTVLITGASSGIGYEFAKKFASEGYSLIVVAQDPQKLDQAAEELRKTYGGEVSAIAMNLADTKSAEELYEHVRSKNTDVDILINNAGFATYGYFHEIPLQREQDEMTVNMVTLTNLTKLFLPHMLERRQGKILNVASTAAFQPGPLMAVYYATKSYVLFLTEAIAEEIKDSGVTITALCPGPTSTGFEKRAHLESSRLFKQQVMDVKTVVEIAYKGLMKGDRIVVPGLRNYLGTFAHRIVPRSFATKMVMKMQSPP